MSKKHDKYVELALEGALPADFSQWGHADEYGVTVAHWAGAYGHLPAHFNQWDLADNNGKTVAHWAGAYGHLPDNFSQWDLVDISVLGCLT
jgi:ankyrin repeat protein